MLGGLTGAALVGEEFSAYSSKVPFESELAKSLVW
jgi:hypothetical protein